MPSPPPAIHVDNVHARALRGPRPPGLWYWQARRYAGSTEHAIWSGWATPAQAARTVANLVEPPAATPSRPDIRTVDDLLRAFLADYSARPDLSDETKADAVSRHNALTSRIGAVELSRCDGATLATLQSQLLRDGQATTTIRSLMDRLLQAWTWGRDRGLCEGHLARPRLRAIASPKPTPRDADVWAAIDHLEGWRRLMALLLAELGCRPGEAVKLTWTHVDLDRARLCLDGKTGPRWLPLSPTLREELRAFEPDPAKRTDRVLPGAESTARETFASAWKRACAAAGVPHCEPYGLRRRACDALYRATDPGTAAAFLGHSPTIALKYYRRPTPADLEAAMTRANLSRPPQSPSQTMTPDPAETPAPEHPDR